ncbi:hypothetical protein [Pseudoalteromonas sp. MMG022]|uniref:hypothetical protein n=1 Tax=Pseudoalteromonas sp. MMG022 TaxID=2909978 RepID=UPI001F19F773|nr:hypothetical protein [Pseudoalteromonas sp. MMG022]MCF6436727.1 hypothetical protein [Pseudoalteromonas sp. MMG022]
MANNNTLYLMGGMPKSGTSCLAGALYELGLEMNLGNVNANLQLFAPSSGEEFITEDKYYMYESGGLMTLNEQMLRGAISGWEHYSTARNPGSGSMLNPPHVDSLWMDERVLSIISSFAMTSLKEFPFGIKDPRITFLYSIWAKGVELAGIKAKGIFSVRPPLSAAHALVTRGWMNSYDSALELWLRYNRTVLKWAQEEEAQVVIYNQDDTYLTQIEALCEQIGLNYQQHVMDKFYKAASPEDIDPAILANHPMKRSIEDVFQALVESRVGNK